MHFRIIIHKHIFTGKTHVPHILEQTSTSQTNVTDVKGSFSTIISYSESIYIHYTMFSNLLDTRCLQYGPFSFIRDFVWQSCWYYHTGLQNPKWGEKITTERKIITDSMNNNELDKSTSRGLMKGILVLWFFLSLIP